MSPRYALTPSLSLSLFIVNQNYQLLTLFLHRARLVAHSGLLLVAISIFLLDAFSLAHLEKLEKRLRDTNGKKTLTLSYGNVETGLMGLVLTAVLSSMLSVGFGA